MNRNLHLMPRTIAEDRALRITRAVIADLFERASPRDFDIRLWDGQILPATDTSQQQFTLVLTHPGALRRMFLPPGELSIAEAYLRGDFDIEGDMMAGMDLALRFEALAPRDWLRIARQVLLLPATNPSNTFQDGREAAQLRGRLHSRDRDHAAVTYHYDVGNDFFALFLGKTMANSSNDTSFRMVDADRLAAL